MTTILDTTFVYTVQVIPPRCRIPVSRSVLGTMPLSLQSMQKSLSPAFSVVFGDQVEGCYRHRADVESMKEAINASPTEFWTDGEQLYVRIPDFGKSGFIDPTAGEAAILANLGRIKCTPFAKSDGDVSRAVPLAALEGRVQGDDRRERVADLVTAARDMVLRDDDLFVPVRMEPAWVLRERFARTASFAIDSRSQIQQPEVAMVDPESDEVKKAAGRTIFRLDRLDQAMTMTRKHWSHTESARESPVGGSVSIALPGAIRLQSGDASLIEAVRRYLTDSALPLLRTGTVEQFIAHRTMMDEVERCLPLRRADSTFIAALRGVEPIAMPGKGFDAIRSACGYLVAERSAAKSLPAPDSAPGATR